MENKEQKIKQMQKALDKIKSDVSEIESDLYEKSASTRGDPVVCLSE